jgi:hypothetical protein
MFPPLPPAMPPWPGGKPPWERAAEVKQSPPPAGQQQQQGAQQAMPAFPVRPQVVHGLVPPQLLQPTLPFWITPQYFRAPQPQPQPQAQPVPQRPQQQAQAPGPVIEQTPAGPVRVERTEEKSNKPQQFVPVLPVMSPGLPLGARQRDYWTRT